MLPARTDDVTSPVVSCATRAATRAMYSSHSLAVGPEGSAIITRCSLLVERRHSRVARGSAVSAKREPSSGTTVLSNMVRRPRSPRRRSP